METADLLLHARLCLRERDFNEAADHLPKYDSADFTDVPYVDAAAVYHEEDEALTILPLTKKELMETEIKLRGFEDYRIIEHIVLEHQDMKATNQKNRKVIPHSNGTSSANAEGITAHFTPLS